MHITKESLYEKVKNNISKEDFENQIKSIQKKYDDLFDTETSALLVVDMLGANKENVCKISELEHGMECSVFGKITNISKMRSFNRKNGSQGRVINLELSDETGSCRFVLWDKDTDLVKNKTIEKGTTVKVINGYAKNGYNGVEINVGRWGLIEKVTEKEIDMGDIKQKENEISGELTKVQPTRAFFKENGEFGFVTNIAVKTKKETKQITLWDDKVKEVQSLKNGDKVELKNINIKERNGREEIHLGNKGKIKKV